jgi:hypothetical protein
VALFGAADCAVEAGFRWLKGALLEGPCSGGDCTGEELCYFSCEPCVPEGCGDTAAERLECVDDYRRTLTGVKFTSGPSITAKRTLSDGSAMWIATFTATAANPYEFGTERILVEGFGTDAEPWVPSIVPADWAFDAFGAYITDTDCSMPYYNPIVNPDCPAIDVPPGPPSVAMGCYTPPEEWRRRWFTIPRKYIPYWGDVAPVVKVHATSGNVESVRLRFYADVDGNGSVLEDPCAYCGDILLSFIPAQHTLVFDSANQIVYAEGPGGERRRAESLVFRTDGTPFDWPLLSCGFGYVVAVDVPSTEGDAPLSVDLSVIPRVA